MDKIKHSRLFKCISFFLIITFLSLDIVYAYPPEHNAGNSTLATPSVLQQVPINQQATQFQQSIFSQGELLSSICSIGQYLLKDELPIRHLDQVISAELGDATTNIDLSRVDKTNGVVSIPCSIRGGKRVIQIVLKNTLNVQDLVGSDWLVLDSYAIKGLPAEYRELFAKSAKDTEICEGPKAIISEPIAEISAVNTKARQMYALTEEELLEDYLNKQTALKFDLLPESTAYLDGKVIMIVGAGGTIGAELSRQLSAGNIKQLLVIDNNENSIYDLRRELKERYGIPDEKLVYHLADVRNPKKIESLFVKYKPNIVFHYGNYKSLLMGNVSPGEFASNNIGGTRNLLQAACTCPSVERFIYISSDKAENPSQSYGRTKRINELLVMAYAHNYPKIKFGSLRYCNVLDAAGSFAIQTFKDQIINGRKVTIRRMENGDIPDRYFISLSTAAKLAIKAGNECNRGEVFSLDENETIPIKIDALVKMLARKLGVGDVDSWFDKNVEFISGERGEKKSEELGMGDHLLGAPMIKMPVIGYPDGKLLNDYIDRLLSLSDDVNTDGQVERFLREIVDNIHILFGEHQSGKDLDTHDSSYKDNPNDVAVEGLSDVAYNIFDPVYGDRMYKALPHIITVAIISSSLDRTRQSLKFIKEEQSRAPPHHLATPVIIGLVNGESDQYREMVQSLIKEIGIKCEIVSSDVNDRSDLMYRLRDKAYYEYGATILSVISDQTDYKAGDINKNIKSLMYYRKPSVIVSLVRNEPDDKVVSDPVDFTFYTDSYFTRERQLGKSFIDQVAPHIILNNKKDNENRVSVSLQSDIRSRSTALWSKSSYSAFPLVPTGRSDDPDFLPSHKRVLFFEPHQDDYCLSATTILKDLIVRENNVSVLGIDSNIDNDYWPKREESRVLENKKAFESIYSLASGVNGNAKPISYNTITFNRRGSPKSNLESVDYESGKILDYIMSVGPAIIVIPAAEDTHRHHVRMREAALKAASVYVQTTGKSLRVFSVPLFSAEEVAYEKANRFVSQSTFDITDKRHILDVFKSQWEYVGGELYEQRHGRLIERAKDRSKILKCNGHVIPDNIVEYECFTEEVLLAGIIAKSPLSFNAMGQDSFNLSVALDGVQYFITYTKFKAGLSLSAYNVATQQPIRPGFKALESIADMLLDEIYVRDKKRLNVLDRRILVNGEYRKPLDWMAELLNEKHGLQGLDNNENVVTALKVLFEKIVSETEEIKIRDGLFDSRPIATDHALYESRVKEKQKLIIGIPSHKSSEIIGERLKSIRDQIRDLPEEWRHWEVEIVICVNGTPEEVDAMGNATLSQIPSDIFNGLRNPVRIVMLKERYPSYSNALHVIYKYAQKTNATMVSITDDDVNYDRYALKYMIEKLLLLKAKYLVGANFYWRRRPAYIIYQEGLDRLLGAKPFNRLAIPLLSLMTKVKLPLDLLWQEIAIFRRRSDIPFSPKGILGAASVRWADDYKGIPYWIRQGDIWERYRYAPYAILAEGASASCVAARTLLYYLSKRPRSFYGFINDINVIFSENRRIIQDDGEVYYLKHVKEHGIKQLQFKDKVILILNIGLHEFCEWLFRNFEFIFNRPSLFWSLAERGTDARSIPVAQTLFGADINVISEKWDQLTVDPAGVTFQFSDTGLSGGKHVFSAENNISTNDFEAKLLEYFENSTVDDMGVPLLPESQLNSLTYMLYRLQGSARPIDFIRSVILVFSYLYAVPDVRASEIMARFNIDKQNLIDVFGFIRDNNILQSLLMKHPIHRNFFDKIKGLLGTPDQIQKMINLKAAFPLATEIHPSKKCNSFCKFCYSKGRWYYKEEKDGMSPLTAKAWEKIVDDAADNGLKRIYVVGGLEPLMAPAETTAVLNKAKERGLESVIFTNGILINPNNAELIDAMLNADTIFVSLRAMRAETYTKVTGTKAFDHVMENIRYLLSERKKRGSNTSIAVAYFITPDNYKELPALLDFAAKSGVNIVGLGSDNMSDLPGFSEAHLAELREIMRKLLVDIENRRYGKLKISLNDTLLAMGYPRDTMPEIYRYRLRDAKECQTLYLKSAINPFGNVFDCCLLAQPGFADIVEPVGQIMGGHSIVDIMRENQKRIRDPVTCHSCNPSEKNGLIAFAKIKEDQAVGIPLYMQPFCTGNTLKVQDIRKKEDTKIIHQEIMRRYDVAKAECSYYFDSPNTVVSNDPDEKIEVKSKMAGFACGSSIKLVYLKGRSGIKPKPNIPLMDFTLDNKRYRLVARSNPYSEGHMILETVEPKLPQRPDRDAVAAVLETARVLGGEFGGICNFAGYSDGRFHAQYLKTTLPIWSFDKEKWPLYYEEFEGKDAGKLADIFLERCAYYKKQDCPADIIFKYDDGQQKYRILVLPRKRGDKHNQDDEFSGISALELSGYVVSIRDDEIFDAWCKNASHLEEAFKERSGIAAVEYPLSGITEFMPSNETASGSATNRKIMRSKVHSFVMRLSARLQTRLSLEVDDKTIKKVITEIMQKGLFEFANQIKGRESFKYPECSIEDLLRQEARLFIYAEPSVGDIAQSVQASTTWSQDASITMKKAREQFESMQLNGATEYYWNEVLPGTKGIVEKFNQQSGNIGVSVVILVLARRISALPHRLKELNDTMAKGTYEVNIVLADPQNLDSAARQNVIDTIASYNFPVKLINSKNNSIAADRNLGSSESKGKYIIFLDDDVRLSARTIPAMLESLEKHPEIGVTQAITYDGETGALDRPKMWFSKHAVSIETMVTNIAVGMVVATRAEIVRAVPFAPFWPNYGEDEFFGLQVRNLGFYLSFVYPADASVTHEHVTEESATRSSVTFRNSWIHHTLLYYLAPDYYEDLGQIEIAMRINRAFPKSPEAGEEFFRALRAGIKNFLEDKIAVEEFKSLLLGLENDSFSKQVLNEITDFYIMNKKDIVNFKKAWLGRNKVLNRYVQSPDNTVVVNFPEREADNDLASRFSANVNSSAEAQAIVDKILHTMCYKAGPKVNIYARGTARTYLERAITRSMSSIEKIKSDLEGRYGPGTFNISLIEGQDAGETKDETTTQVSEETPQLKPDIAQKATQLFEIVGPSLNNEAAKFLDSVNKLINSMPSQFGSEAAANIETLYKKMSTAEIARRAKRAIEMVEGPAGDGLPQESRDRADTLKKNLNQFEADGAVGALIVLARKAQRDGQKLIIGLETDWIPGMNTEGSLQRNAISALMKEIDSIGDTLRSMGLDNVEIVRGSGSDLSTAIIDMADKTHTNMRNVVVMASSRTINSESFLSLRNAKDGEKPFLAGIDPSELIRFYSEFGEATERQLYIGLTGLLYMTLELAAGKEPPQTPVITSYDKKNRIIFFLPKVEPIEYEALRKAYNAEVKALTAA